METYKGSCHCGRVEFSVKTDQSFSTQCDCSLCRRRGGVILRCDESDLEILSGNEFLLQYQFNENRAEHYFCQQCGIHTFYRLKKLPNKFGINSGCLEGVDISALTPSYTEGSKT